LAIKAATPDEAPEMVTSPLSLRLPAALREKVEAIAAMEHRSLADTVKMLAEEAIKRSTYE